MSIKLVIIFIYLLLTLLIGFLFKRISGKNEIEFFLAGRHLKSLLLFFTLSATNFSAFTIFGFSGAGYRIGYAFYPIMGFGTGFMALSFYVIGEKIMILSKKRGYITPSDFVYDRYRSPFLKILFSTIMVIFTLPYISIQSISAGKAIHSLTGLPYILGATIITTFVMIYVATGGMRSIVWTDLIQGLMMITFTSVAFMLIIKYMGGFTKVSNEVYRIFPDLYSRPGKNNIMKPGIWVGYMLLWFFADPMFPHLFQRFIAAESKEDIRLSMILYPIITTILFLITVSIGVIGRYSFPVLEKAKTDAIFSLLISKYLPPVLGTVLFIGSIAALMSTMDSQILTLTSMISLDFLKNKKHNVSWDRFIIFLIGTFSLLISYRPPMTILNFIRKTTFNGLGVLAPSIIGGLYWKRGNKYGAIASILIGETLVLLYYFNFIKTPGILPFIIIILSTIFVYIAISIITTQQNENTEIVFKIKKSSISWLILFLVIFILANDFWNWGKKEISLFIGLPVWVWYFIIMGIILTVTYSIFIKKAKRL